MTHRDSNRNDLKLLLTTAGIIVAGAAVIALLAGLSAGRSADEEHAALRAPAPPAVVHRAELETAEPTPVLAAVYEPTVPPVVEQGGESSNPADAEPVAAPFAVDPTEDFIARGLETWRAAEYEKSAAYFAAEVDSRPVRAWSHYMLGMSLWKDRRVDDAAEAMHRAAELDPTSVKSWVNLSRIHNDRGAFEAALEAARAGLSADPESGEAWFLEARSLRNLGRPDEALVSLDRSLELDPENPYALNLVGLIRLAAEQPGEAIDPLQRAAEIAPGVAYIHNNLGMALELDGAPAEAVAAYRRATEADAGHTRAAANLSRLEATDPVVPVPPAEPSIEVAVASPESRTP